MPVSVFHKALAFIVLLAACSCAHRGGPADRAVIDPGLSLEARVQAYWQCRMEGDFGAAYEFYSPGFKKTTPRGEFLKNYRRLVRYLPEKVELKSVEVDPGGASARVINELYVMANVHGIEVPITAPSIEVWVLEGGQWWKLDEKHELNI